MRRCSYNFDDAFFFVLLNCLNKWFFFVHIFCYAIEISPSKLLRGCYGNLFSSISLIMLLKFFFLYLWGCYWNLYTEICSSMLVKFVWLNSYKDATEICKVEYFWRCCWNLLVKYVRQRYWIWSREISLTLRMVLKFYLVINLWRRNWNLFTTQLRWCRDSLIFSSEGDCLLHTAITIEVGGNIAIFNHVTICQISF